MSGTGSLDYTEMELKQVLQFTLPVAYQTRWRHDQNPSQPIAHQLGPDVESRHDRFASPGIVRQQKTQGVLLEHVLVHSDMLVGQRIDQGGLCGEFWIFSNAVAQTKGMNQGTNLDRVAHEVQTLHSVGLCCSTGFRICHGIWFLIDRTVLPFTCQGGSSTEVQAGLRSVVVVGLWFANHLGPKSLQGSVPRTTQ